MLLVGRQISPEPPSSIKQTMATPNRLRSWRLHGTATPLLGFAEPNGPTMLTRSFNPSTPGDNRRGGHQQAPSHTTPTRLGVCRLGLYRLAPSRPPGSAAEAGGPGYLPRRRRPQPRRLMPLR